MGKRTKHKDEFLVELGKRIREQRKLSGFTQEELAKKADLSAQMISTTERATKEIKIENLYKLSRVLHISTDYLLSGQDPTKDYLAQDNSVEELSEEERKDLNTIIEVFLRVCKRDRN